MGARIDTERRNAMATRSRELRSEARQIIDQLTDPAAKDFFRRLILFPLDDVDSFVLGDPHRRPSADQHEALWLSTGDMLLDTATSAD